MNRIRKSVYIDVDPSKPKIGEMKGDPMPLMGRVNCLVLLYGNLLMIPFF